MNWKDKLAAYVPRTEEEACAKREILTAAAAYGTEIFYRKCASGGHITCSGMILDETGENTLMVYHNIYQSFSWTGGHADGNTDFLDVAAREAMEETGITAAEPLCSEILSLDMLPVAAHEKKGKPVPAHMHYNVTYGLVVRRKEKLRPKPDENSDVKWIPVKDIGTVCKEAHMLPVYEKIIARMLAVRKEQRDVLKNSIEPLCDWYRKNARDLPWRRTRDPYCIWVSETMLQQTRVETVKGYYTRFLETFPTIRSLAEATEEQVHKLWEGLGYYSRARNLRLAAKQIVNEYGGVFPTSYEEIHALPGVGDYTAGAVCSICYGQPTAAVDGNVLRVVMRLQDSLAEIDKVTTKQRVIQELSAVYPEHDGEGCGALTQALMELGASVCIPGDTPRCEVCPVREYCRSRKCGTSGMLPVRKKKLPKKQVDVTVFILRTDEKYAVCKRPLYGLLASMWEFPNIETRMTEEEILAQVKDWGCNPLSVLYKRSKEHVFTHLHWKMEGVYIECGRESPLFQWKTRDEVQKELAIPTVFRKFFI